MRLSELYFKLSPAERAALADRAGMSHGYLYQLATRWDGRRAAAPMLLKLANADKRLTLKDMVDEFSEPVAKKAEA